MSQTPRATFPRLPWIPGIVLGVVLGMAGCGDPATPERSASPAGGIDACELLTAAEIASELGRDIGDGVSTGNMVPTCQWPLQGEAPPFIPQAQITLVPDSAGSYDLWMTAMKSELEADGFNVDPDDYRSVDGVGEWAVYLREGGLLMVGQRGLLLQLMLSSGEDHSKQLALASLVLGRLP